MVTQRGYYQNTPSGETVFVPSSTGRHTREVSGGSSRNRKM